MPASSLSPTLTTASNSVCMVSTPITIQTNPSKNALTSFSVSSTDSPVVSSVLPPPFFTSLCVESAIANDQYSQRSDVPFGDGPDSQTGNDTQVIEHPSVLSASRLESGHIYQFSFTIGNYDYAGKQKHTTRLPLSSVNGNDLEEIKKQIWEIAKPYITHESHQSGSSSERHRRAP